MSFGRTIDCWVSTMSVIPLPAIRTMRIIWVFCQITIDYSLTTCKFIARSTTDIVDGLGGFKHGEWSFLALTGSELRNGGTVYNLCVDGSAVAASVNEVVIVLLQFRSVVVVALFVVGTDLKAVSMYFNVTGEKVSDSSECHV